MGRIKSLDEIKAMVRARTGKRNTFRHAKREDVESVLASLTSKDPELWAQEWSRVAKPYEEQGESSKKQESSRKHGRLTCKPILTMPPVATRRPTPRAIGMFSQKPRTL